MWATGFQHPQAAAKQIKNEKAGGSVYAGLFLLAWVSVECRRAHPADSDRTLAEGENVVDAACQMHRIRDEASYFTTTFMHKKGCSRLTRWRCARKLSSWCL